MWPVVRFHCRPIRRRCEDGWLSIVRVNTPGLLQQSHAWYCQGGICRGGGSRGTSPSLDLTFPPTGLSENLGGMERGGEGKRKGKGGGDHLPYSPPPLASASNTTLGIADGLMQRLQEVQNAAARLIPGARRRDHISPVLRQLHWLPVCQRDQFKLAVLVFKALHGQAPQCLTDDSTVNSLPLPVAVNYGHLTPSHV